MRYRVAPSEPSKSLSLDPARAVCYVLPEHSWIDLLTLERICVEQGLPPPVRSSNLPTPGRAACLYLPSLIETRLRRTSLSVLIERAIELPDYDIQIIPVSIFWGRDPGQETSLFRLLFADIPQAGTVRKLLTMLANGRSVLANLGQPLSFRTYIAEADDAVRAQRKLTRAMHFHFLRARTAALGPTLLSRRVAIDTALATPDVQSAIDHEAKRKHLSRETAEMRARRFADEIAADYRSSVVTVLSRLLTLLWTRVFSGVEARGLERVRELAQSHAILYLPSHRSHADYLLISYLVYQAGLSPPHIAAGINLDFWPIGGLLRRCGAFFMRRSFTGDKLYVAVFRAYVNGLIRRGYSISFYPEGTRSRTGRLLAPKSGMMSIAVEAALRSPVRKVAVVPVFIVYDKVWELNRYFKELRGGAKQRESAEALLKATRILGEKHGRAYVSFGEPVILQDDADVGLPGWRKMLAPDDQARPEGFGAYVKVLAREHMRRINAAAVANPVGLFACALLASPARAAGEDELVEQLAYLIRVLDISPSSTISVPVTDPRRIVEEAAPIARVRRVPHPWGDLLIAAGRDGVLLTYARNSVQHLFAVPSLIARLFRTRGALREDVLIAACGSLYPFLRNEFFLPWPNQESDIIAKRAIDRLVEIGLLTRNGDRLERPAAGSREFSVLATLGRILGESLERYAIAILLLAEPTRRSERFARSRFIEDCRLLAERMALLIGREAPEFFDKALFSIFLDSLIEVGAVRESNDGHLTLDTAVDTIAARSVELLSDETRQTLAELLARRRQETFTDFPI